MSSRYSFYFRLLNYVTDLVLINASYLISFNIVSQFVHLNWNNGYHNALFAFNLIWLFSSFAFRLYAPPAQLEVVFRKTWRALLLHLVLFMGYLFFSESEITQQFFVFCFAAMSVLFLISRFLLTYVFELFFRKMKSGKRIAIIGYNSTGKRLADYFYRQRGDYIFEGFFDDEISRKNAQPDTKVTFLDSLDNCMEFVTANGIQEIYSTIFPDQNRKVETLVQQADEHCVRIKFVPDFSRQIKDTFHLSHVGEFPVITLRKDPLENLNNRLKKRIFDIIISSFVIIFILSWLVPLASLLIKLTSSGPVFFVQKRSGKENKTFRCYKFRSMKMNQVSDQLQASKDDVRITKVGAFLRKTSLDEFPQFLNVLTGNMSIVGPRPHMLKHTEEYSSSIDKYMVRHFLKPGITGWAQVNGYRGETETPLLMQKRVEHDLWYLENWSLMLDVRIFFLTVFQFFRKDARAY